MEAPRMALFDVILPAAVEDFFNGLEDGAVLQ